jgi:hypothetical protein
MSRPALIHRYAVASLALTCIASAWWGCAKAASNTTATTSTTSSGSSSGGGGTGGTGTGTGTGGVDIDGGNTGGASDAACVSTSAAAHRIPLDMVFLIDQSGSMEEHSGSGTKWSGISSALKSFCNDPASAGIGVGLLFLPYSPWDCNTSDYESLVVPIAPLPGNAFAITNAFPAMATGVGTPMYPALQGALMVATAYQDAHPTHKVVLVLATDGDPNGCDGVITDIAGLAASALSYDGVQTYVIGCVGSTIANLDIIAQAGGTTSAYDVTTSIDLFAAKIAEIRQAALGCDFQIPAPPNGQSLDPNEVNFQYTPMGTETPVILPRVKGLADCSGQPGWYYDNDVAPTNIILCPASCSTVQDDVSGIVNVLFGCKSIFK